MQTIIVPNGTITIADSCFNCPKCDFSIESTEYHHRLERTPQINAKCPNCNTRLALTVNYKNGVSAYINPKKKHINKTLR